MKKKSNLFWIGILAVVLLISVAWIGIRYYQRAKQLEAADWGPIATIYLDGRLVDAIDLSKVKETYTLTYEGASGNTNNVEVAPGQIRVHDATCPDQICVGQGWLDQASLIPIACLPNSLMIYVSTPEDLGLDTIAG